MAPFTAPHRPGAIAGLLALCANVNIIPIQQRPLNNHFNLVIYLRHNLMCLHYLNMLPSFVVATNQSIGVDCVGHLLPLGCCKTFDKHLAREDFVNIDS